MAVEIIRFLADLAMADAVFILLPAAVMAWVARMIVERWEDGRTDREV